MAQSHPSERQISQLTNQLELLDLYVKVVDQQFRMFVLSRLKQILLQTSNNIFVASSYLFDANWAYQQFLFFSLKRNDINKKQIVSQLKLLYHVVSLRIKFWFTEKDLQQFFLKIFKFLQQQQRSAFHCLDFFVEFIDAFQNQDVRDEIDLQTNKKISHYRMTRCTTSSMDSLNFKTKKSFGYRDSRRLVKQNCYQRKDKQINSKIQPKVSKKIQAYILNKGLNRMITIANSFLNRSIIVNQNYEFEDDSFPYIIKVSHQKIAKILNLLHKSFTYDFYSTQKTDQTDQYTADRSPIILPTKFSKYSNFGQFQRWIKNLDNVQVYQYLFFITTNKPLKIIIVNILGDMLRIHMKYFKTKNNYKTHLESIILPFTNILEKTELQGESNHQLAMAIGSNIQKLLAPSTVGIFIGLSDALISNFIQALDTCIKSYILYRNQLNPYLIRYYVGFLVDFHSKILFQKNLPRQNKYLKSDIQKYISGLGQQYQKQLLTSKLNEQDFDLYFQIFKIYKPKATLKEHCFAELTEEQSSGIMINCTCKFIHFLSHYQSCVKNRLKRVLQKCQQWDEEQSIRGISQTMFNFTQFIQKFLINQKNLSQNVKIKGIITLIEYVNYILEKLNNEQSRIDYFQLFSEYFNIYSFVEAVLKLNFSSFEQISHLQLGLNQKKPSYQHEISHLVNKLLQQLYSFMKKNLQKYKKCENNTTIQRNTLERRSSMNWSKIQLQQDNYGLFLQSQCENLLNLLKKISQMFKILFLNQQNKNQQQHKEELHSKIKLNSLANLNLKIQYAIMNQLKDQSMILQSINFIQKIYYVVIEQIDLHRENHINHFKQKQLMSVRSTDNDSIYYQNQFEDSKDNLVCQNLKIDCYCTKNIHQFNLSIFLNCFNIFSYFQMLNENDLIKRTHEDQCQTQNFYCNNQNIQQSLYKKQHSNKNCQVSSAKQYREFYSLNKMIKILFLQMRRQCCKGLWDIKKIKLLETIKILLKFFRTKKHDSQIKIQILNECHLFLIQQIKLINNEHLMLEEGNNHQEYTKIITLILECSHSILTHMLTSEIYSNKINLLNQDLILIFNFQNCHQKKEAKNKVKQIDLSQPNSQCQQQQETSQTRRLNQNQAQMFNKMNTRLINFISYVIELIINFPNNLIQHQGFNQIRQALSSILVEIYYEFSAFKNIFLLQNPLQFEQKQNLFNSIDKIEIAKQQNECSYFLKVDESNIKVVIGSYNIFIKFVSKLLQFSIILPNNLISLSKYNQFFLEQIHQFIQNYFKFSFKQKYQSHQNQNKCNQNQNKRKQIELSMKQIFLQPVQNSITQLIQCQIQFLISFFSKFQTQKLNLIKCQHQLIKNMSKGLDLYTKNMTYSFKIQKDLTILRNLTIFPKIKEFEKQKIMEQNFPKSRRYYNALQYIYHIYCQDSQKLIDQIEDYQKYYQFYVNYKQIEQSQVNNQSDITSISGIEQTQFDKQFQQNQMQITIYEQESFNADQKKLIKQSQQLQIQIQTQQNLSNRKQNTPHKQNATKLIQKIIHDQKINCGEKYQQKQTIIDELNKESSNIQQNPGNVNLSPQRYGYIMNLLNIYTKDEILEKRDHFQPKNAQYQQQKSCHQQSFENSNDNHGRLTLQTKKEEQQSNQEHIQDKQEINWYDTHQSSLIDLTNQNRDNLQSFQVSEKGDDHELKVAEVEIIQIMSDSQEDYDKIPKLPQIEQLSQQYSQNKKQSL